jgi:adenylate cyclase
MRILLVEDDVVFQEILRRHLTGLGYLDIKLATSGQEAIEYARESVFDISFMDINLHNELDGIDTARQIKEFSPDTTIIFVSANVDPDIMDKASGVENFGFINKPYNSELIERYINLIARRKRKR